MPKRLDEAQEYVRWQLAGTAEVHRVRDLIDAGLFGPGESVWWYEQGRFEQRYRGRHGGLTRERWKRRCWRRATHS